MSSRMFFDRQVRNEYEEYRDSMIDKGAEAMFDCADEIVIYKSLYQFLSDEYNDDYVAPLYNGSLRSLVGVLNDADGCSNLLEHLYGFSLDYKYDFEPFCSSFIENFIEDFIKDVRMNG